MGDDITIGVTEIVNNIEVTAQPNDQIVDISVIDNADEVTLNITPTVIEINVNKGSSFAKWGTILGTLSDQTDLQNALNLKANLVGGKVPASELPSYVDDVVEVADYAALPATGETGKIYVTLDNNKIYRWSGSVYIEIAANNAIWGAITGTLSSQTDLQTALDTKALKTITITPNAPLSGGGDLSANRTISISQANTTTDGYLSSTDWNTFNNKENAITAGTTLQYYRGDKTFQTLNTSVVPELTNLYYTEARVSANTDVAANTAARHSAVTIGTANGLSLSTQALSLALASTSTTGALSSTDWNTFNGKQNALTNPVTGTGTTNYIPKFTGSSAIGNSLIFDNGTNVGIGTTSPTSKLQVEGNIYSSGYFNSNNIYLGKGSDLFTGGSALDGGLMVSGSNNLIFGNALTERMRITSNGELLIGRTTPYSAGWLLAVEGNVYAKNDLRIDGGGSFGGNVGIGVTPSAWSGLVAIQSAYGVFAGNLQSNILLNSYYDVNTYRYVGTGEAARYRQDAGVHSWLTAPSGTAGNAITFEERMRITSSGSVGIGTSSPTRTLEVVGTMISQKESFSPNEFLIGQFDSAGNAILNNVANGMLAFNTNNTRRMTITSAGDVLVGRSSLPATFGDSKGLTMRQSGAVLAVSDDDISGLFSRRNSNGDVVLFRRDTTTVGSISVTTTLTSYNVTSDYRLKQDFKPFNGLDLLSKIKVYDYEWKADNSRMNGVIAHELQEVIPYAVTGEKDAKEMQQVDYSKLVPILVQAIQELKAEIEILKTK